MTKARFFCLGLLCVLAGAACGRQAPSGPPKAPQPPQADLVIRYEDLSAESRERFEAMLSVALGKAVEKSLEDLYERHGIHDTMERSIIVQTFDEFRPPTFRTYTTVAIHLVKPGERQAVVSSFEFSSEDRTYTLRYKCVEGQVATPTAIISYIGVEEGRPRCEDVVLSYSAEQKKWKPIPKGPG